MKSKIKRYFDFYDEIDQQEIYAGLLGYGLFTEKLPPIFSSEKFYQYCIDFTPNFKDKNRSFIYYESIRNINIPRQLGIPNPFAYHNLCKCISDNWRNIQKHFREKTCDQNYVVSRLHFRKMDNTKKLFKMNYDNWKTDGEPELDLLFGNKYIVHADVSTCFPSIYSHSISWALVGKEIAKKSKIKKDEWYNKLDHFVCNCKNGETHGVLIGPHASNLIGEIILTTIDLKLCKKWKYIRKIDDYTCFVKTKEEAHEFLIDLSERLREYDLNLNHKKTLINELPIALTKDWVNKISFSSIYLKNSVMDYVGARAYFDNAVEIMKSHDEDSAILNYAIKSLPYKLLSNNAKEYCIDIIFSLCLMYPYLLQILDEFVFQRFDIPIEKIQKFSSCVYSNEAKRKNYDSVCFALFFSLKYNFKINDLKIEDVKKSNSCVFLLLSFLYYKKNGFTEEMRNLKDIALKFSKSDEDFDKNWLFVYEVLPKSSLRDNWVDLKTKRVSFLKDEFQCHFMVKS